MINVIGIDPGPKGYAAVALSMEGEIEKLAPNPVQIARLNRYARYQIAIETPQNYGKNTGRSIIETCITIGRLMYALEYCGVVGIKQYGRPTVKGVLQARNDQEVRSSLRMRYCKCDSKGACKRGCPLHGLDNDDRAALAVAVAVQENPGLKEW